MQSVCSIMLAFYVLKLYLDLNIVLVCKFDLDRQNKCHKSLLITELMWAKSIGFWVGLSHLCTTFQCKQSTTIYYILYYLYYKIV